MKVICESCSAQYDLDDSRIPPSGIKMKCPACLHQFTVKKPAAAPAPTPPPALELDLSPMHDDEETPRPVDLPGLEVVPKARPSAATLHGLGPEEPDLPAPKAARPPSPGVKAPPSAAPSENEIDLPAPVMSRPAARPAAPPPSQPDLVDLPAPVAAKPKVPPPVAAKAPAPPPPVAAKAPAAPPPVAAKAPNFAATLMGQPPPDDGPDLPAPKSTRPKSLTPSVPVAVPEDAVDLPAPKATRQAKPSPPAIAVAPPVDERPDLPAPKGPARKASPQAATDVVDLPAPKDVVDLPAPKDVMDLPAPKDVTDLLAPKRSALDEIGLDLDAPDPEDRHVQLPAPKRPATAWDGGGPPGLDEAIDVVAPKSEAATQRMDDNMLAPVRSANYSDRSLDDATPIEAIPLPTAAVPRTTKPAAEAPRPVAGEEDEERPRRGLRTALITAGAAVVLVGGVGVGVGVFTGQGYFASNLWTGKRADTEVRVNAARKLFADDTLASYKKAAVELKQLTEADPSLVEAAALEAQARLCEARLGVSSEAKTAETLLGKVGEHKEVVPELERALALKLVVGGRLADARSKLTALLAGAPSDATGLQYLGWTELQAGDLAVAESAFVRALQAEPTRTAALFGAALCKERRGDTAGALELYTRALARSPNHFGALVGQARASARGGQSQAAQQKIEALIAQKAQSIGPRELADAWTSVGQLAAGAGRREEAEDRFKRALALDPSSTAAKVALAGVECDQGKPQSAVKSLQAVVSAEPKNLDARVMLVRALVEAGLAGQAPVVIKPAAEQAPKDPHVLYWQGEVALKTGEHDRDKALAFFKQAVEADPRYIAAYLAESNTFAQLGKPDDALDALKQAEAKASDDPSLMAELGESYLQLGKAADAEARFRAALDKKPDYAQARIDLGAALEAQDKPDDAVKEYATVAEKEPDFPGLAERQARLALRQGKKEPAWELYQKALKQGVPTQSLRLAAAQLALDLGKHDDAMRLAESVVKEDDRSAPAHLLLARTHLAANHPEDALAEARRAASLADLPEAHLTIGRSLELLGKLDQSVQEFSLARRPPVEGEASLGRARILVHMGATRDALTELTQLAKDPKLRAPALLLLGDSYADQGQPDKARKAYEDAVKANPQAGDAAFKLARSYLDAGKRKPAIELFERALKLGGDKAAYAAEAYLFAGDAHRELKENDAAVRAYKKYLELAPADSPQRAEVGKHLSLLGH